MARRKNKIKQINCDCGGTCKLCLLIVRRQEAKRKNDLWRHKKAEIKADQPVKRREVKLVCECGLKSCNTCYSRKRKRRKRWLAEEAVPDLLVSNEIHVNGRSAKDREPEDAAQEIGGYDYKEFPLFAAELQAVIRRVSGNQHRTRVGATL